MEQTTATTSEGNQPEAAVAYAYTKNIPELLAQIGASLVVSTYQAQRVLLLASNGEKMSMLMRVFERPTGIALREGELSLVTKKQIWWFSDSGQLRDLEGKALPYDICYVPRLSHVTGDILGHEAIWCKNTLVVVNTRFSCLCVPSQRYSFEPIWKPPFISAIVPEDRCHINGVTTLNGKPRFVTALGETDTKEGWRENKAKGGVVIDIDHNRVIASRLSMPHSPRWYNNQLYILESGTGSLLRLDPKNNSCTTIATLPGYLRGLSFFGPLAFVGLCKIRGDRETFSGLPIEEKHKELKCAIYVVNIENGETLGYIDFTKGIEELFDVHVLPGYRNPHMIGFEEDTLDGIFVVQ